jgi:hypothetical protein
MKNKREDWCYVCGEFVPVGEGIAETKARQSGDAGWGATRWVVRHTQCKEETSSVGGGNK